MFSNHKRHVSDSEVLVPASRPSTSRSDNTDSTSSYPTSMVGRFSLQTKSTQKSTGLHINSNSSYNLPPRNFDSKTLCCSDYYRKYNNRVLTFDTWPNSHPIRPEAIARAEFIYTGQGDKVICPWFQIKLIDWECFDIPMDEHQRHSPNCDLMLMLFPRIIFSSFPIIVTKLLRISILE